MEQRRKEELAARARELRHDIVDMVGGKDGKVGHLGGSCSIADVVAVLYFDRMKHDPKNPKDPDRDRFLLSKGHAALVQYAALSRCGYFPREELHRVKTCGAMLQGHPDLRYTPGVEANTGSLGQGLSIAVGMALGLRLDGSDRRVFVVMGDGEQAEGQIWEAAMAAANFGLDHLVGILDCNGLQATGATKDRMDLGDLAAKWAGFGWNVLEIDGHDLEAIDAALTRAEETRGRPTLILARTVKGKGVSFAEGQVAFHNGPLSPEQYRQAHRDIDTIA